MSLLKNKWFRIMLAIVLILAILLCIPWIADRVSDWTGIDSDTIKSNARNVAMIGIGLFLISAGAASVAVPIVGIVLVAVGLILIGAALWSWFGPSGEATSEENASMEEEIDEELDD